MDHNDNNSIPSRKQIEKGKYFAREDQLKRLLKVKRGMISRLRKRFWRWVALNVKAELNTMSVDEFGNMLSKVLFEELSKIETASGDNEAGKMISASEVIKSLNAEHFPNRTQLKKIIKRYRLQKSSTYQNRKLSRTSRQRALKRQTEERS